MNAERCASAEKCWRDILQKSQLIFVVCPVQFWKNSSLKFLKVCSSRVLFADICSANAHTRVAYSVILVLALPLLHTTRVHGAVHLTSYDLSLCVFFTLLHWQSHPFIDIQQRRCPCRYLLENRTLCSQSTRLSGTHSKYTARWFGHAMLTAMNTRAKRVQTTAHLIPQADFQVMKKGRRKPWIYTIQTFNKRMEKNEGNRTARQIWTKWRQS